MSREWMDRAACAPDPHAWDALDVPDQIQVCHGCPVLAECTAWARDAALYRVVAGGRYWRPARSSVTVDEIRALLDLGEAPAQVAIALHVQPASIRKLLRRHGQTDLADRFRVGRYEWTALTRATKTRQVITAWTSGRTVKAICHDLHRTPVTILGWLTEADAPQDVQDAFRDAATKPRPQTVAEKRQADEDRADRVIARLQAGDDPEQICADLSITASGLATSLTKLGHPEAARPFARIADRIHRERHRAAQEAAA